MLFEFFTLCLLRVPSNSDDFFVNNFQVFQLIGQFSVQCFQNQNKNSLLFEKSVFFIGNYLCKGIQVEQVFNLLDLVIFSLQFLQYDSYFQVYSSLIWLLRIIFVFLESSQHLSFPKTSKFFNQDFLKNRRNDRVVLF